MMRDFTESERKAFHEHCAEQAYQAKIADWLKENPVIGRLNGDRFYRFEDGLQVFVQPPFKKTPSRWAV